MSQKRKVKIAMLGGGNMSQAIVGGLIENQFPAQCIWVIDHNQDKLDQLQQRYGVHVSLDSKEALEKADMVFLAVKPQGLVKLAQQVGRTIIKKAPLLVSVAAGITLDDLGLLFGKKTPIVRTMPNTPGLIGCGVTGLYANDQVSSAQRDYVERVMRSLGVALWLEKESDINALMALAGCGPAYHFLLMQLMQKTAEEMGLSADVAHLLTLQTGYGAAKMALETQEPLEKLMAAVMSKGGATEAAINTFIKADLSGIVSQAMEAAAKRGVELSNELSIQPLLPEQCSDEVSGD